ncbi:MAG: porin family protein [Candidatus Zixiibacteriota bacterium]
MKKLVIVLAVILLTATFAQATELGFKAGLNMANLSGDIENNKTMTTFGGGVFARLSVARQFFVKPELLYVMKGTQADSDEVEDKLKFEYIEIPVLVGYQFPTPGPVSPSIFAGPSLGILMSANNEEEGEETDISDVVKSTDFGLVFGGGVDVAIGTGGKLTFDGRYTFGLSNLNDDEDFTQYELKNRVFSFYVGYSFAIGM